MFDAVVTRYTALATALNPNIVLLDIVHSLAGPVPGCWPSYRARLALPHDATGHRSCVASRWIAAHVVAATRLRPARPGWDESRMIPPHSEAALDPLATAKPRPIGEIAARLGLTTDEIEPYGRIKAKLPLARIDLARAAKA